MINTQLRFGGLRLGVFAFADSEYSALSAAVVCLGFASKAHVALKVGFLPQSRFRNRLHCRDENPLTVFHPCLKREWTRLFLVVGSVWCGLKDIGILKVPIGWLIAARGPRRLPSL